VTAALLWAAARLRRYVKGAVALGLLMAGAGGMVLAVADGAQRASSAFTRLMQATATPDGYLFVSDPRLAGRAEHLPAVKLAAAVLALAPSSTDYTPVVLTDRRFGTGINRFKYLSGRRPSRADEAMIPFTLARSEHLHLGSILTMPVPGTAPDARSSTAPVRIVGIVADTRSFPPLAYADEQAVYLDPSFLGTSIGRAWSQASGSSQMIAVQLRGGLPAWNGFLDSVQQLSNGPVGSDNRATEAAGAERSMHLQSLALWLTAGFGALVVLVVASQLLLRQLAEQRSAGSGLRALGMTTAQLFSADMAWVAAVALVAAAGSALVAWLASPLFPLGTARVADPVQGLTFDTKVVVPGAGVVALAVMALGAVVAWNVQRAHAPGGRTVPAGAGTSLRLQRLPVVVSTGIRLALRSGRGRGAVPTRTTIGATAAAIGGVVVAMTFAASLTHLLSTPRLYGTTYDADVQMNQTFGDVRTALPQIQADPDIAAIAVADTGIPFRSGHQNFGGEFISDVRDSITPTVVAGRLPEGPDEILLGVRTMGALHTSIGRTIEVAVNGITSPLPMKVVGSGVLTTSSDTQTLGKGAIVAPSAVDRFMAKARPGFGGPPGPGDAFVRFRPGIPTAQGIANLTARLGGIQKVIVTAPTQPTDVVDFGQVRSLPQILAGLLSLLAAATMAYLLISAIRRRRRELAILKTIGFVPSQISAAVAWQATTVAVLAMLVGIPLGIVAGRAVWSAIAHDMGVVVQTQVPWPWIALVVPAVVLVANLLAAGPAAVAGRISATTALRDE
jgi:hypothetical protein